MSAKKELLVSLHRKYQTVVSREEKTKIIDALVFASGYKRKYAISLLNKKHIANKSTKKSTSNIKYDERVKLALITIWNAANRICSKRLKPFIPQFIVSLENYGHLLLPDEIKHKLLTISTGTIDFILKDERTKLNKTINTTRSGSILKKQIKVRTFADWDDVIPGFFEADLVAHCGGSIEGSFLNTLTLTDIATSWTECIPLLCRSKENVIDALQVAMEILPFKVLGIDTDNGSEFINHALIKFCEINNITFTRSRSYKKNDQAHVEEKNGSIVRRIVGYDRFEGIAAWKALTELYANVRLYVNFFQPSLKLISKSRNGAKVTKKYDAARTPNQRLIESTTIPDEIKLELNQQSNELDPLSLLHAIQINQKTLWQYAWQEEEKNKLIAPVKTTQPVINNTIEKNLVSLEKYRSTAKPNKMEGPRLYRTRKDPFEGAKDLIRLQLEMYPNITAKDILNTLIMKEPSKYKISQIRTLQRRVADWRKQLWHKKHLNIISELQYNKSQEQFSTLVLTKNKQSSISNTSN